MTKTPARVLMILLMAPFLLTVFLCAQDWTGQGRQIGFVYDEEGNPLEGVKVKLVYVKTQSGKELISDKNGKWVAMGIKGGTWNVDFEKIGYAPKKISITVIDFSQKNPTAEIRLKKIEGLVITEDLKEDFKKGNDLFDEEKFEEAIAVFTGIVEKFPDAYFVNLNIGHGYFKLENYEEAEKSYKKLLESDNDHVHALISIGNCHMNQGNMDKALEWYNKIEFEKIDDPIVLYNVGTVFYNNSNTEEALKYYKKSVEIQEGFLDGHYQLGLAYLTLGRKPDAIAEFETYLKFDPDSERAAQVQNFLEFLRK
jgi:tetratricopeptide (TPR) repeat protein